MRKNPHVHTLRLIDQPIDRVLLPHLPCALLRVADEHLCDSLLSRQLDDAINGVRSLKLVNLGAQLPCEREILLDRFLRLTSEIVLFHIRSRIVVRESGLPRARRSRSSRAHCCGE